MAKVSLPLLSGEVRGRVGDIVFMQRHGKSVARRFTKPRNTNSLSQQVVRHNFKALNQCYKGSGDMVQTDTNTGKKYVMLWKYDKMAKKYTEVQFEILTADEKTKWEEYSMKTKGYKALARNLFIAKNQKQLSNNLEPVRLP
ncbi:MAG: hypothetical protein ACP5JX_04150 [Sulfurihydrogenibium sp.]